jgi:iron complex outermembrane receptor protein
MFGAPSRIVTGIDYYDADYHSTRSIFQGNSPAHVYDLQQRSVAGYWQQTLGILPTTDVSYGARIQRTSLTARDSFDAASASFGYGAQSLPLDQDETQHALHIGMEHRLTDNVTVFGRAARAFRTPNVDERVFTGVNFDPNCFCAIPQNFQLKTQTSHDIEAGIRFNLGPLAIQSSVYDMWLRNEIHYNPADLYNYNLDPTRRTGSETSVTYVVNESLKLRGGVAVTRAVFREGPFSGKDVPLVSRYTANAGFSWNIWKDYLVLDTLVRYWSDRRLDNDQNNRQPKIPADATLDLKLSGQVEKMFWSLAVNNLFDAKYYDYGIASATTLGTFNAYPLPGRTYAVKAGVTF